MTRLDVTEARNRLHAGGEIAFLDLREAGQFGEGHALLAAPAPWSRLEVIVGALVPRLTVPVLLIDGGDGVAERAAARLQALGYTDVSVVAGGMPAWEAAGFAVYKGVFVPSKTLGELAETLWHPQMITADELASWQHEGRDFHFLDTRPAAECAKMRVPGAVCMPNGELAHRIDTLPADAPLVVTCAGRTRGIIGAIGLALIGAGDRVRALENGTQGWTLSGRALERDTRPAPLPRPDEAQLAASRARADQVMARWNIQRIDAAQLAALRDDPARTTYLFDLRMPDEIAADPVAAAVPALGVQLVQATDQWVGVRRARIVLCCDTGLRSAIAAFWLYQLGYEVAVAPVDAALRALPAAAVAFDLPAPRTIDASQARGLLARGAQLLDLRPSQMYRAGHVRGAIWANRAQLPALPEPGPIVLLAETPALAALVGRDLRSAGHGDISIVAGGHAALVAAGLPVEATPDSPADADCIDFLFFVHDRHDGNMAAARAYLDWETGLVAQLDPAERAEFRLLGPDSQV